MNKIVEFWLLVIWACAILWAARRIEIPTPAPGQFMPSVLYVEGAKPNLSRVVVGDYTSNTVPETGLLVFDRQKNRLKWFDGRQWRCLKEEF